MVRIQCISEETGCEILAKMEFLNPGGTPKDRVAARIVQEAISGGWLKRGGTIVEGTSGSTGIALAMAARAYGCFCEVVIPDDQAIEKEVSLKRLGATVHRVKVCSIVSDDHYVNVARRLGSRPGCVFGNQFDTLANFRAHLDSTGPEIHSQCDGRLDAFVMGAGTGGTIAGVSRALAARGTRPHRASSHESPADDNMSAHGSMNSDERRQFNDEDEDEVEECSDPVRASRVSTRVHELRSNGEKTGWRGKSGAWVVLADPPGSSLLHSVKHGVCYAPQ